MAKQNIINDDNFSSYEKDGEEIVENAFNKIVSSPKERGWGEVYSLKKPYRMLKPL